MARARSLKPGFFKNEELCALTPFARLLFAGLWTIADREGRLEDRPKRIKAEVLPYDDVNCEGLLIELAGAGFIIRYATNDGPAIQIPTWHKHQNPHLRENTSLIPAPEKSPEKAVPSTVLVPAFPEPALPLPVSPFPLPVSLNPLPGIRFRDERDTPKTAARPTPPHEDSTFAVVFPLRKSALDVEKVWKAAGFEGPEEFEQWYDRLWAEHPQRHGNKKLSREGLAMAIGRGETNREQIERRWGEERAGPKFTRQQGKFAPSWQTLIDNAFWNYPKQAAEPTGEF